MKEISDKNEKNILGGLVLDEKGQWVSIAEKVERERSFLMHLEAGEILCEGKWVSIRDVHQRTSSPAADHFLRPGTVTQLDEMQDSSNFRAAKNSPQLIQGSQSAGNNSSPNPFIAFPILEAEEETKYLEKIDLRKEKLALQNKKNAVSDEYLEETMSFDMKTILGSANESLKKNFKMNEIASMAESWDLERKRNQVMFFSITATVALFAIVGAVILAFLL